MSIFYLKHIFVSFLSMVIAVILNCFHPLYPYLCCYDWLYIDKFYLAW